MPAGEDELNCVFWKSFQLLGKLSTFYSTMLHGLSHGIEIQFSELEATGKQLYEDGTLASWVKDPSKAEEFFQTIEKQKGQLFQSIKDDAKKTLDGAAIIYAHGILDASVYGYLEVLSLASPDSFGVYIEKKQVSLIDTKSKTYDQLYKEKVKEYMEDVIEKSSLMFKLDKMHEITKPSDTLMNREINYDRIKFKQFDAARHNIVHGNNWSSYSIDFTQELFYWNLLNFYLLKLVVRKTGLKLSKEYSEKYFLEN